VTERKRKGGRERERKRERWRGREGEEEREGEEHNVRLREQSLYRLNVVGLVCSPPHNIKSN
jgi:hypothetical protein